MTFTVQQIDYLKAPLDRSAVKERVQGGGKVSYVEAYHAENEANRIFGFDAWDRETEISHIGEREVDGKWRVYYRAKVRITVRAGEDVVVREGCGFGSGIDRDIGQAHESALKEAESDAEKRALKTFGNPFGQALYDKSQSQVADTAKPGKPAKAAPDPLSPITDDQRTWLQTQCEKYGGTAQDICEHFNVTSFKELVFGQLTEAKTWLENRKKAA